MNGKALALALALYLLPAVFVAQAGEQAMMPWPAEVRSGEGRFALETPIQWRSFGAETPRIAEGINRWTERLSERTGKTLVGTVNGQDHPVVLDVKRAGELRVGEDETYTLQVTASEVRITAPTDLGALRGLATLYQLLANDAQGWYFPAITITDRPRFPWRGLLIDVCRHFMPRDLILRELDGMELVKLNVLHLHLTDDQGFRIESTTHPELHLQGSNGQYLTQEDIRVILREADRRGIRVVPEFDLPGHATSWFVSHPELASAAGPYVIETRYGVMDPAFDPSNEATYALLEEFLGEMARLFPDACLHIGVDGNNGKQWAANVAIQAYMKAQGLADAPALQAHFNARLHAMLKKHGKRMIGWDEIGEGKLPADVAIQIWRGKEGLAKATSGGHDVLLSNGYSIDLCRSAEEHYLNDPLPPESTLSAAQRAHVLGGEATLWSELVDPRTVDTRIWPRTAAIAERLWSPASVNNVENMYTRLSAVSLQLDAMGLRHISGQEEVLRMLVGSTDTAPLKRLVDVIVPLKDQGRHELSTRTTRTPLTALADAAMPDPLAGRDVLYYTDYAVGQVFDKRELPGDSTWVRYLREHIAGWMEGAKQAMASHDPEVKQFGQRMYDMVGLARNELEHKVKPNPYASKGEQRKHLLEYGLQQARDMRTTPVAGCDVLLAAPIEKMYTLLLQE